ncbi:MAG: ATP-dependent RecD-like DNA helicase [Verrucomicrobiota bacterium]|nr:MAG: ATP-dependent RecD-like DNA helicase [Verrucomicrobiota bacterium]
MSTETLQAVLERIVYRNEETFFAIMAMRSTDSSLGTFTACGKVPGANCGETLTLHGSWTEHPKFGRQFEIESFSAALPADVSGIRKYLSSGMIHGIGKVYADKIVDYFGADTLDIISTESARLTEVPGIGVVRARSIKAAWDEQYALRDIMIFLQTYDISNALCLRLYRKYGNEAKQILQSDPYRVAREVEGIGFKTADKIAQNIGIPSNHIARIDAGILHIFSEIATQGHTAYPLKEFLGLVQQLLAIGSEKIEARIKTLISFGRVRFLKGDLIQLELMASYETQLLEALKRLRSGRSSLPPINIEGAIAWAQKREGFPLASEQVAALRNALGQKLSIITGGPGTGKTTILRALVSILRAKNVRIGLAAPTGRAAQKMAETTGCEAKTIHRLLQYNPQTGSFSYDGENQLPFDFVIIDETSMIDTRLAVSLFVAIPPEAHILLVGDNDQLPSVGAGNILADFIGSGFFSVTYLVKIFRQGKHSEITQWAHRIIHEDLETLPEVISLDQWDPERDFTFIAAESPEDCVAKVEQLCTKLLPQCYRIHPVSDIQILAPLHRGTAGIDALNTRLQECFSSKANQVPWCRYRLGDKVIQLRNNYEKNIFNGDLGYISRVNADDETLTVTFNDERVLLSKGELGDLALAYAISIHKSQGSEFPIVVIPLLTQHYVMLQRNLLYTAVTRGRNKVFLVGDPKAYRIAVSNKQSTRRITGLPLLFHPEVSAESLSLINS